MAHKKQAKKRIKQNEKHEIANRALKSEIRTTSRKVFEAVEENDAATAQQALRMAEKKLDKAAKNNVIHANNVARKKSRLTKAVNTISG